MTGAEYFAAGEGTPTRDPEWLGLLDGPGANLAPGIVTRPAPGESTMLTYVQWDRGGVAPMHSHIEEQLLLVLEGEVEMTVAEQTRRLLPGDVVVIPPWTPHTGVGIAERSVAVEAFSPVRRHLVDLAPPVPRK